MTLEEIKLMNQVMSWFTGVILLACLIVVLVYEYHSRKKRF